MARIVDILVRLVVILIGYFVASLAASAFIHLLFFAWAGFGPEEAPLVAIASFIFSIPFVALFVAYFAFIPASVVVLAGELLSRRDWLFYALGGGLSGLIFMATVHQAADRTADVTNVSATAAVIAGGIFGGIAYWTSAGRWAGNWRGPRPPQPPEPILPAP